MSAQELSPNVLEQGFFFLSEFSFTDTDDSQDSRGRGGPFFIPLYHFHRLTNIQTFATLHVRWLSHIFNRIACIYQTATRWDFPTLSNYHLIDWLCEVCFSLFTWWFDTRFLLQQSWYGKPVDSSSHRLSPLQYKRTDSPSVLVTPRFVKRPSARLGNAFKPILILSILKILLPRTPTMVSVFQFHLTKQ